MDRPAFESEAVALLGELCAHGELCVLTGAGCSTESGIPDYRGDGGLRRKRPPVQYAAFVRDPEARRRYWARSLAGWPRFSRAQPNAGHRALAELERAGLVRGVITQNVDGLHHGAGSRRIVELHGSLARVRCLDCDAIEPRDQLQARMVAENPNLDAEFAIAAPDGDAELAVDLVARFRMVDCLRCGGTLKPDVVLFGESVPKSLVEQAWELVDGARALLVVGSSLAVYSGFRFVRGAHERGLPIAIVNLGPTRADALARCRLELPAGALLSALAERLVGRGVR